jgi:uncharacterized protein DUF6510
MNDSDLRLDGNAAAGLLGEIFAVEMTTAQGCCASCGNVGPIGAAHLYMSDRSPGAVLRCPGCEQVLMVAVARRGRRRLSMPGVRWIDVEVG